MKRKQVLTIDAILIAHCDASRVKFSTVVIDVRGRVLSISVSH